MKRLFKRLVWTLTILVLVLGLLLGGTSADQKLALLVTDLENWEYEPQGKVAIYYQDNDPMLYDHGQWVPGPDYPEFLKEAVVAVEDRRFYQHNGLDPMGIGRAVLVNMVEGTRSQGASTITQQLARTLFLTLDKTYSRKIKEIMLATALEEKYTKKQILAMYLNEIYMGRGCSGLAGAARIYFNKEVWELNQAETCMLVGMIQSPEHYDPDRNWEGLKIRQEVVVNVLTEQGLLDPDQAAAIKAQPVSMTSSDRQR